MSYASNLASFQQAMLGAAPELVKPQLDTRPALDARLNVYIEGYRIRLVKAVTSDYPTLARYLGPKEMERLARAYVETTPPTSYTLDVYPVPFARYVAQHADSFAAALAATESAIAEVFWLPESAPFVPTNDLTPEKLMTLQLHPRIASRLLALNYPVEHYLLAVREERAARVPAAAVTCLFIVRHENEVKRHVLQPLEAKLLGAILGGRPIGAALEALSEADVQQATPEVQQWFTRWISGGFFRQE